MVGSQTVLSILAEVLAPTPFISGVTTTGGGMGREATMAYFNWLEDFRTRREDGTFTDQSIGATCRGPNIN
jgi:hypothetical protein